MSMPVPQKIVLKNSTNMSLNDRFTKINKVRPPVAQTVTVNMANQHQASIKSRRLAQQMSNRNQTYVNEQYKPPVKSRLGIASRLGFKPGFGPRRGRQIIGGLVGQNDFPVFTPSRGSRRPGTGFFPRGQLRGQRGFRGGRINTNFIPATTNNTSFGRRPWGGRRGRGGRGGVGRGGVGSGRTNKVEVTKDQLDTELDAYMSHTN